MKHYYEFGYFFSSKDNGSLYVTTNDKLDLTDIEACTKYALDHNLIDDSFAINIVYVNELTEDEAIQMGYEDVSANVKKSKKKPIIQICFSLKTGLSIDEIKEKLLKSRDLLDAQYGNGNYECRSCHLSKVLCLDKGWSTDVPDMFEEVFGDNYVCELAGEKKFSEAMAKINDYRTVLSKKADRLIILNGEDVTNVALELELFTSNRVIVL